MGSQGPPSPSPPGLLYSYSSRFCCSWVLRWLGEVLPFRVTKGVLINHFPVSDEVIKLTRHYCHIDVGLAVPSVKGGLVTLVKSC